MGRSDERNKQFGVEAISAAEKSGAVDGEPHRL
jgi:hypothetical protein